MKSAISGETTNTIDVLIVANYASTDGSGNCRFGELANRLTRLGADVELVTSNFEHDDHSFRHNPLLPKNHKLTLVHETGYSKNISAKRLVSHYVFARNLGKYLDSREVIPDLIYCALPSPAVGKVCARHAQRHDIAFVVDVQDLWPEAFGMRFKSPKLLNTVFSDMVRASRSAYRQADLVLGVSQTYVDHAQKTAGTPLNTSVVFLGASLEAADQVVAASDTTQPLDTTTIVYVGTLSHSYDIPLVIDALSLLVNDDSRYADVEFLVLGDGPMRHDFEAHATQHNARVRFLGNLAYPDMLRELRAADIAVNPIVAGSAGSVLNKVGDYAAAGLPVINTQESPEYRALLDEYDAGLNCRTGSTSEVAAAIRELVENPADSATMGRNNRRMAEELFDRDKTYAELAQKVMGLASGGRPQTVDIVQ